MRVVALSSAQKSLRHGATPLASRTTSCLAFCWGQEAEVVLREDLEVRETNQSLGMRSADNMVNEEHIHTA